MENASKALLMAGGVLIAVLTIALLVMAFSSSSQFYKTQDDIEAVEQITAFNQEYESYNKKLLRGTDVISVCNKALSNNEKYSDVPENQINVKFKLVENLMNNTLVKNQEYSKDSLKMLKNNSEDFSDFKRRVFNCTNVTYRKDNGRIESITFVEQKIDYTEGL